MPLILGRSRAHSWQRLPAPTSRPQHSHSGGFIQCTAAAHSGQIHSPEREHSTQRRGKTTSRTAEEAARHSCLIRIHLDPALAQGVDHGLGAVVDRQLAQDRRNVIFDGLIADIELDGDFLIGAAGGHEFEHL